MAEKEGVAVTPSVKHQMTSTKSQTNLNARNSKHIGCLKDHSKILEIFKASVPSPFDGRGLGRGWRDGIYGPPSS